MASIKAWLPVARWICAALFALVAAGCSSTPETKDPTIGWSAEKLYADAKEEMSAGRYASAIKTLEKIEARYPFGRWAQQAQIDIAYAQYKDNERALALATTDRFLKLYPNHPRLDYVYYLRGLINFNEQSGFISTLGGQDLSERDLEAARTAFDAFREIVTRFPDSVYAPDAEARMKYLVNSMASSEVHIARYYYRRGAYVAAANRAQDAIRHYRQAPALEEALFILMSSYDKLGLADLRDDTRRVLDINYPNSRFFVTGIDTRQARWWELWK
jgi:outer membrane protein assembly factor BamD